VSKPLIRILLVEDNENNWDMLSRLLRRRGYEVLLAHDGEDGVRKALAEQPALVLMDLSLPVIDGWEAARRIRTDPAGATMPIIALSAHALSGDREKAKQAGCDDYHSKPVDLAELLTQMEALLARPPA
jgi:two-component system cell cycle response regulator DivK